MTYNVQHLKGKAVKAPPTLSWNFHAEGDRRGRDPSAQLKKVCEESSCYGGLLDCRKKISRALRPVKLIRLNAAETHWPDQGEGRDLGS